MKGYKATNKDMTCLGYQFELGKEHVFDGPIQPCVSGFHFCKELKDVMQFYHFNSVSRYFEVEIPDDAEVITELFKSVTNMIKFVRELSNEEIEVITGGSHTVGVDSEGLTYYKIFDEVCYYDEDGKLHREDGPACVTDTDHWKSIYYYKHGKIHREDGPAGSNRSRVITSNETFSDMLLDVYYINGNMHREDGFAFIRYRNEEIIEQYHYLNGNAVTEEVFNNRNKS